MSELPVPSPVAAYTAAQILAWFKTCAQQEKPLTDYDMALIIDRSTQLTRFISVAMLATQVAQSLRKTRKVPTDLRLNLEAALESFQPALQVGKDEVQAHNQKAMLIHTGLYQEAAFHTALKLCDGDLAAAREMICKVVNDVFKRNNG